MVRGRQPRRRAHRRRRRIGWRTRRIHRAHLRDSGRHRSGVRVDPASRSATRQPAGRHPRQRDGDARARGRRRDAGRARPRLRHSPGRGDDHSGRRAPARTADAEGAASSAGHVLLLAGAGSRERCNRRGAFGRGRGRSSRTPGHSRCRRDDVRPEPGERKVRHHAAGCRRRRGARATACWYRRATDQPSQSVNLPHLRHLPRSSTASSNCCAAGIRSTSATSSAPASSGASSGALSSATTKA